MTRRTDRALPDIRLQRAYEDPGANDGYRVLVDHYWPRGRSRDALKLDEWARDLAPEPALIQWFGHKPERWDEFRQRYGAWLKEPAQLQRLAGLLRAADGGVLTLVYGARNETQNQAVVIREALIRTAEQQRR